MLPALWTPNPSRMVLWGTHQCRISCRPCVARVTSLANATKVRSCSSHAESLVRASQHAKQTHKGRRGITTSYTKSQTPILRQLQPEPSHQRRGIATSLTQTSPNPALQQDEHSLPYTRQREVKLQDNHLEYLSKGNIAKVKPTRRDDPPDPSLTEDFRKAMRGVAYPIAVITNNPETANGTRAESHTVTGGSTPEALQGLLASSFNTITIKPEPYVSLNIKVPSRTWTTIKKAQEFLVHVMWSAEVAQQFAPDQLGAVSSRDLHSSAAAAMKEMEKGRMFGLRCQLTFHHPVADHVVVVGKVLNLLPQSSNPQDSSEHEPLLWRNGTWHTARPLENKT